MRTLAMCLAAEQGHDWSDSDASRRRSYRVEDWHHRSYGRCRLRGWRPGADGCARELFEPGRGDKRGEETGHGKPPNLPERNWQRRMVTGVILKVAGLKEAHEISQATA